MAFNNGFPIGYQPQFYQQNQQPQYTQQPSINWVLGDREAAAYPVAPNNAVALWSQSEPVVYLKQADATGKPSMKVYDLVERTIQKTEERTFVTREEFDKLKAEIESLRTEAPRRKVTVKKQEDDE